VVSNNPASSIVFDQAEVFKTPHNVHFRHAANFDILKRLKFNRI
jgi:hypothetical protein